MGCWRIFYLLLLAPVASSALLKNNLSVKDTIPQACQITYLNKIDPTPRTCSGTLVSPTSVLSAAHCEYFLRDANTTSVTVNCSGHQSLVDKVILLDSEQERTNAYMNDILIYKLKKALPLKPVLVATEQDYNALKNSQVMECRVFGFGGDANELSGFQFSFSEANQDALFNPEFSLNIPVGTITSGDSGGSYLCRNSKNSWRLYGVVNQIIRGHDLAESLYRHLDFIRSAD